MEETLPFETRLGKNILETPSQQIKLGMVLHTYHPSYKGGINRKVKVQADPDQKKKNPEMRPLFKK
jgi:hypothetical protein